MSDVAFKGVPSGLKGLLVTQGSLEMIKNGFYFTSNALFVLNIFKFLSLLFAHDVKLLD